MTAMMKVEDVRIEQCLLGRRGEHICAMSELCMYTLVNEKVDPTFSRKILELPIIVAMRLTALPSTIYGKCAAADIHDG